MDAYGVLHDGAAAFPGAPQALAVARHAGLGVVIVTNSAERIDAVAHRLLAAGIASDCYDHVVSSGELTWRYLERQSALAPTLPRLFVIREGRGPGWVADLPNPITPEIDDADLLVAGGMPFRTEDDYRGSAFEVVMSRAVKRGLTMIVADSDVTYPSHGRIRLGPGWLADRFTMLGGRTVEFGKPQRPIYAEALRVSGSPEPASVLMIGDNLLTDIAGANGIGMDSLLVLQRGVHGGQTVESVNAQAQGVGLTATYALRELAW